jgi:hypothetical protein
MVIQGYELRKAARQIDADSGTLPISDDRRLQPEALACLVDSAPILADIPNREGQLVAEHEGVPRKIALTEKRMPRTHSHDLHIGRADSDGVHPCHNLIGRGPQQRRFDGLAIDTEIGHTAAPERPNTVRHAGRVRSQDRPRLSRDGHCHHTSQQQTG